jgi:hypothetical protein
VKGKLACQWRQVCRNCSFLTANRKYECFMKFCTYCNNLQLSSSLCYVAPLKPSNLIDRFMYVFFDTECTQDLQKCDGSFEHISNLICDRQMCYKCEAVDDLSVDCEQCGKRTQIFLQDPVGKCIISGSPDHLQIRFMLFDTTLVETTHSFYCAGIWNRDRYLNL